MMRTWMPRLVSRPCDGSPSPCAGRRGHNIAPSCSHCMSRGLSFHSSSTPAGEPQSGACAGEGPGLVQQPLDFLASFVCFFIFCSVYHFLFDSKMFCIPCL